MTPENRFALDNLRKEAAKAYNAFFAGAPVGEQMVEAEKRLFDKLEVFIYGGGKQ